MRILIILLLILIAVTACATQQAESPITHPIPIVAPGNTQISLGIPSSTSIPVCVCLTSVVTPAQSQGEEISHSPVICNCPAIIVTPPNPALWIESNPQAIPANGITMANNGKTFIVHSGESFLLNLGIDVYDWAIDIDN